MPDKGKKPERPSFEGFWKKSDSNELTFVAYDESESGRKKKGSKGSQASSSREDDGQSRNQARRSQVRKAQLQHRQRKAEYVEQLQTDIKSLHKNIEETTLENQRLELENNTIRETISRAASPLPFVATYSSMPLPASVAAYPPAMGSDGTVAWWDPSVGLGDETMPPHPQGFVDDDGQWVQLGNNDDQSLIEEDQGDLATFRGGYEGDFDHQFYYGGRSGRH